jgi:aminopeptidase N
VGEGGTHSPRHPPPRVRLPPHTCQVAARMTTVFTTYRAYDTERQTMMKAQLQRIVDHQKEGLSENVFEIASKALA